MAKINRLLNRAVLTRLGSIVITGSRFLKNAGGMGQGQHLLLSEQVHAVIIRNTEFTPHSYPGEPLYGTYVNGGELSSCAGAPCAPGERCTLERGSLWCSACEGDLVSAKGIDCLPCTAGKGPNERKTGCVPCPVATYNDGGGRCVPCQAGTEANSGKTGCVACTGNEYSADGSGCRTCEAGHEPAADRTKCEFCPGLAKTRAGPYKKNVLYLFVLMQYIPSPRACFCQPRFCPVGKIGTVGGQGCVVCD